MKLFVYGSLKKGCHNHGLLRNARYLGDYSTEAKYTMVDMGSFPGVFHDENSVTSIHGEIYEIDETTLTILDRLEGHPNFFHREKIMCDGYGEAWVYLVLPRCVLDINKIRILGIW